MHVSISGVGAPADVHGRTNISFLVLVWTFDTTRHRYGLLSTSRRFVFTFSPTSHYVTFIHKHNTITDVHSDTIAREPVRCESHSAISNTVEV